MNYLSIYDEYAIALLLIIRGKPHSDTYLFNQYEGIYLITGSKTNRLVSLVTRYNKNNEMKYYSINK